MMIAALLLATLSSCTVADVDGLARCGTISVPENRAKRGGRTIALNTIVLPALKKSRGAIFPLQGGPGQAVTPLAGFYAKTFAAARENYDIVLVDQRGTGKSNPLNCDVSAGAGTLSAAGGRTLCGGGERARRSAAVHHARSDSGPR